MLYCEIILFSVLSLVLGHVTSPISLQSDDDPESVEALNMDSPQPTSPFTHDVDETEDDEVMDTCVLGHFPTPPCMLKCFLRSGSTYCDEDANCRCVTEDEEDDEEGSYRAPLEDVTTPQPDIASEQGVMGICYGGIFPSPFCVFRCSVRWQSAVCDEDSRCMCEDRNQTEVVTPTHSPHGLSENGGELTKNETESDNKGSIIFLIFDLGGLFEPEDETYDQKKSGDPFELWTVSHFLIMAILTIAAALLVLELTMCCKRRYSQPNPSKQHLQTVLTSEGLEKGVINVSHS